MNDAQMEDMSEEVQQVIEEAISKTDGGKFLMSQEESVEFLQGIAGWCRDRAAGIREEAGLD